MTLAALSDIAQVIGAIAVVASLIFVGVQLRQNTMQMRRGEANSAMEQGSSIRQTILASRDIAELITDGVTDARPLDAADAVRLDCFFGEIMYLSLHVWDREKADLVPRGEFKRAVVPLVAPLLTSRRGAAWWARSRDRYAPEFAAALETAIPALAAPMAALEPASSATAPQPAETGVAPHAEP